MEALLLFLAIFLAPVLIYGVIKSTKEPLDIKKDNLTTIHDNSKKHKISDLSPDFDSSENLRIKQEISNCFSGLTETDYSVLDKTTTFNDGQNSSNLD